MITREGCDDSISVEFAKHEYCRGERAARPTILRLHDDLNMWPIVKLSCIEFFVPFCDDGDHFVGVEQRANLMTCLCKQSLVPEHPTELFGTCVPLASVDEPPSPVLHAEADNHKPPCEDTGLYSDRPSMAEEESSSSYPVQYASLRSSLVVECDQ